MAELLEQIQTLDRRELLALIREAAARLEALESAEALELSPAQKAQTDEVVDAYKPDDDLRESWQVERAQIVAEADALAIQLRKSPPETTFFESQSGN